MWLLRRRACTLKLSWRFDGASYEKLARVETSAFGNRDEGKASAYAAPARRPRGRAPNASGLSRTRSSARAYAAAGLQLNSSDNCPCQNPISR